MHGRLQRLWYVFPALQVAKMWLEQGDIVLIADSTGVRYAHAFVGDVCDD
jgi:hypothetical protein